MKGSKLLKIILQENPEKLFIVLDGLDNGVIGAQLKGETKLKYSFDLILEVLQNEQQMDRTEAIEFFYFNIESLQQMKHGPIFIDDI